MRVDTLAIMIYVHSRYVIQAKKVIVIIEKIYNTIISKHLIVNRVFPARVLTVDATGCSLYIVFFFENFKIHYGLSRFYLAVYAGLHS